MREKEKEGLAGERDRSAEEGFSGGRWGRYVVGRGRNGMVGKMDLEGWRKRVGERVGKGERNLVSAKRLSGMGGASKIRQLRIVVFMDRNVAPDYLRRGLSRFVRKRSRWVGSRNDQNRGRKGSFSYGG
jgi:hypothetical protein